MSLIPAFKMGIWKHWTNWRNDNNKVISFIASQLNNPRNVTRRKVEAFLRKIDKDTRLHKNIMCESSVNAGFTLI